MIPSSSAITTRTVKGSLPPGRLPGLGHESVEQLVLRSFELGDRVHHRGSTAGQGIGVSTRLAQLTVGKGRLRHEVPDTGLVRRLRQRRQLLVDNGQLLADSLQPGVDLDEATLDE